MLIFGLSNRLFQSESMIPKDRCTSEEWLPCTTEPWFGIVYRLNALRNLYSRSFSLVINTGRCYRSSNGHKLYLPHRSETSKGIFPSKIDVLCENGEECAYVWLGECEDNVY